MKHLVYEPNPRVNLTINYEYGDRSLFWTVEMDAKEGIWLATFIKNHPEVVSTEIVPAGGPTEDSMIARIEARRLSLEERLREAENKVDEAREALRRAIQDIGN